MDRLFWPEPQFMSVAGLQDPWVLDLRGRVEEALNAAVLPLRVRAVCRLELHKTVGASSPCTACIGPLQLRSRTADFEGFEVSRAY